MDIGNGYGSNYGGYTREDCFVGSVCISHARVGRRGISSIASASAKTIIPAKLHTRPRHKRQPLSVKQPFRFNLPAFAFVGVFANVRVPRKKRHSPPLPQKAGADGVGHSLGEGPPSPKGEPYGYLSLRREKSSLRSKTNKKLLRIKP